MSQALYDSLLEKWQNFLSGKMYIAYENLMRESDVNTLYEDLVDEFCEKHSYSERTKEMAFHGKWWDTFKDEFYKKFDEEGCRIIHETPMKGDWDFAKKFNLVNGRWEEVK